MTRIIAMCIAALLLIGCAPPGKPSTDADQARKTEAMVKAADQAVGMPNITNFTEKRFAKLIYELKDGEINTYSYFMDLNGRLHFLCNSVGYGMPSSVQFVNPERLARADLGSHMGQVAIPQPEPNGLFMPEGLAATFVLCADDKGGVKPVYSEPSLIVSPMPLNHATNLSATQTTEPGK